MSSALLTPSLLASIDDLELVARLVVEGALSGLHRSPFHGYSAEFSQHRAYGPGDDLRHLDWKLLARTDRLYTKQFRETTNMSVCLVLDASASMAYPPDVGPTDSLVGRASGETLTKFRYAAILAAALAHLVVSQGDSVALMTGQDERRTHVPARGGRNHLKAVLAAIARTTPQGTWRADDQIARAATLLRRRGLVIVLSDFYDREADTLAELKRTMRRGHDVAVLQIISRVEMTLPYRGAIELEDLESHAARVLDASAVRRAYQSAIGGFLQRWRGDVVRAGMDYALMIADEPPAAALRAYLLRRSSGHRREMIDDEQG